MTSLTLEESDELPRHYQELVDRLLHLFGLGYLQCADKHQTMDFGWFMAHVHRDKPSETYLMWCSSNDGGVFFKMADYELLNIWEPDVQKAVETLRGQMVLDDVANGRFG